MKFTFACKKIALNDSIKEYAEKKISKLDRYFAEEADAFVTFALRCGLLLPATAKIIDKSRQGLQAQSFLSAFIIPDKAPFVQQFKVAITIFLHFSRNLKLRSPCS